MKSCAIGVLVTFSHLHSRLVYDIKSQQQLISSLFTIRTNELGRRAVENSSACLHPADIGYDPAGV